MLIFSAINSYLCAVIGECRSCNSDLSINIDNNTLKLPCSYKGFGRPQVLLGSFIVFILWQMFHKINEISIYFLL